MAASDEDDDTWGSDHVTVINPTMDYVSSSTYGDVPYFAGGFYMEPVTAVGGTSVPELGSDTGLLGAADGMLSSSLPAVEVGGEGSGGLDEYPLLLDCVTVASAGGSFLELDDLRSGTYYIAPLWVEAYRGGVEVDGASPDSGFNPAGDLADGTAAPDTHIATPNGLPAQVTTTLASFVQNVGNSDGVAIGATISPTATLTAIAAAGRNPTDITIPVLVGSEGSGDGGGDDDAIAAGSTSGSPAGSPSAAQSTAGQNASATEVASVGNSSSTAGASTSATTAASGSLAAAGSSGSSGGATGATDGTARAR